MNNMLIPKPFKQEFSEGFFVLSSTAVICFADTAAEQPAQLLADYLRPASGFALPVQTAGTGNGNCIVLQTTASGNAEEFPSEHYRISVKEHQIKLAGDTTEALVRAIQTLRQLFPPEIYADTVQDVFWQITCQEIDDSPAFRWRGMMIDSARHFFPKEQVCRMIELFAQHKINIVHLHLTDDQGWRVEIKKYPRLTGIGSVRLKTVVGHECDRPRKYDDTPYGGFYTQDDLREIVDFAARRCITLVPEIDMPGHMAAAICAYPDWGNFPENHVPVRPHWGISYQILSPRKEVIEAMKDILGEIMDIFPGKYIHVGGDEARKDEWEISPDAQEVMAEQGCRSEKELQDYFTGEINKFICSRNRRMLGWEEILNDSLEKSSIILSWRDRNMEMAAVKRGISSIIASRMFAYFDYYQADTRYEPVAGGECLPLEKVYQFRPLPDALAEEDKKYILGGQGQLWSEYIPDGSHQEYMAFPRSCALAEKLWTPENLCRLLDFKQRLQHHRRRLAVQRVNACPLP